MLMRAVPWRILSRISSRNPFESAHATISAATPMPAAMDRARPRRLLRLDLRYLKARKTSYGIELLAGLTRLITVFPVDTSSCLQVDSPATVDSSSDCHAQSDHPAN